MFNISMLPAKEGDAIWVEWGEDTSTQKMLIDMGTNRTGEHILDLVSRLPENSQEFELLVITHVDRDHIGGTKSALIDPSDLSGLAFRDIWFNGRVHLEGKNNLQVSDYEHFGAADGEDLTKWLKTKPWNEAFRGEAICRKPGEQLLTRSFPNGLTLTVIGPPKERLTAFLPEWDEKIKGALESGRLRDVPDGFEPYGNSTNESYEVDIESYGRGVKPTLNDPEDLKKLAGLKESEYDDSHANGSSIALILEYEGLRILLAGDAFASDLVDGLEAYSGEHPLRLDAFKVPHHGSLKNINAELVKSVKCKNWLISTDGTRFKHPDASAMARIIQHSVIENPKLWFNVESVYNEWWKSDVWQNKFNYQTEYGTDAHGLTLTFG